jgi:DNA-directed RNA polymerase beta subunit
MEKDTIVVHGSGRFLTSKLREDSDGFDIYVCGVCGKFAIVNEAIGLQKCKICGDNAEIYAVPTAWASKLTIQEFESMNVGVRLGLRPYWFEEKI